MPVRRRIHTTAEEVEISSILIGTGIGNIY
jgi:hypothetical protein